MSIITISRGSFSKGKEVAEKVAQKLGYASVSREVIIEASEEFNVSEVKLDRAIHEAPSIFERFSYGKERYLAYIASELLNHFQKDNVVYHGLAGHFFVKNISHVLKVRILAEMEDRIRTEMAIRRLSWNEALETIEKDDRHRREWSLRLYGVDTWNPGLYDLVIRIRKLTVDDAVDLICETARKSVFLATPESRSALDDLALAARVKAAVVKSYPNCSVTAASGAVTILARTSVNVDGDISGKLTRLTENLPGVRSVEVRVMPKAMVD